MKTIGVFIATPGRRSLFRTLYSIAYQAGPGLVEDVLVVGDGHHEATEELCAAFAGNFNLPVRYVATEKTRDWGHTQQNYALQHVRGDYVVYQDDDDVFLPRAFDEMSALVSAFDVPKPLVGRVKTPRYGLLWQRPGEAAVLDGHCLVVPNDKKRLGWFNSGYNGDQCYLHTTLRNYSDIAWADRAWTLTRPTWQMWPVQVRPNYFRLSLDDCGMPGPVHVWIDTYPTDTSVAAYIGRFTHEVTEQQYVEAVEFLTYAAQGKDCLVRLHNNNPALESALKICNYKEHQRTTIHVDGNEPYDEVEYAHDWPPDFWPALAPFDTLTNAHGEPIPDWRDEVWGGRPVP